jgi:hypothetical protein
MVGLAGQQTPGQLEGVEGPRWRRRWNCPDTVALRDADRIPRPALRRCDSHPSAPYASACCSQADHAEIRSVAYTRLRVAWMVKRPLRLVKA